MDVTARALLARRGTFTLDVPSFEADSGGTAVLGPNGAGKTTLLLALQGLIAADGALQCPARCAAVFARPAILRGTTLWNVSAVVRRARGTTRAEADARARRVLGDVGLANAANTEGRTLSTGQRHRLALARALACEPQALFLDEPFANVDADGRPELRILVQYWAKRSGCALVLATSSLADTTLCARSVVLNGGHVVHAGPVAGLRRAADPYVAALLAEAAVP